MHQKHKDLNKKLRELNKKLPLTQENWDEIDAIYSSAKKLLADKTLVLEKRARKRANSIMYPVGIAFTST